MTSVLLRILRSRTVQPGNEYVPNLPPATSAAAATDAATDIADQPPAIVTAEVNEVEPAGSDASAAAAQPSPVETQSAIGTVPGQGLVGSGSRVLDALVGDGWDVHDPPSPTTGSA
jgi:hypothetical protein